MAKADKKPQSGEKVAAQGLKRRKENPEGKQRRKRGRRGRQMNGGEQRKQKIKEIETSPTIVSTTWKHLETGWFRTFDSQGDSREIPNAVSLAVVMNDENDQERRQTSRSPQESLRCLWHAFSRKRTGGVSGDTNWQPMSIQLQAWSILLPPDLKKKETEELINMIGLSPTASGKTLSFGAPMVVAADSAKSEEAINQIFGIILVPTRELAQQVSRELKIMFSCLQMSTEPSGHQIRVLTCLGSDDQSTQDQIHVLRKGPKGCKWLISATPGRLLDIVQSCNAAKTQDIQFQPKYIILDESDRLAINTDLALQVTSILKVCLSPQSTTLALFSATYPHKADKQWREWMNLSERRCAMIRVDAVSMEKASSCRKKQEIDTAIEEEDESKASDVACTNGTVSWSSIVPVGDKETETAPEGGKNMKRSRCNISDGTKENTFLSRIPAHLIQILHVCAEHKKPKKLMNTIDKLREEQKAIGSRQRQSGIIFFARIKTLQYISNLLAKEQSGYDCVELHSKLPQHVRTKNMQTFKAGKVPILLATDIAARGLHVSNISFVVNYDFPPNLEQYVHRCGRAGRNANFVSNEKKLKPTIYSFFTRSLAPLAGDLVALLQASEAWVDPNLKALLNDDNQARQRKKGKADQQNTEKEHQKPLRNDVDHQELLSDDDAFPELSANKVVLKRASHVSDASSSSEEEG